MKNKMFDISVNEYDSLRDFHIYYCSSLINPCSNSLMFVMEKFIDRIDSLETVKDCLVFWPEERDIPAKLQQHVFVKCKEPRIEYSRFFNKHNIDILPVQAPGEYKNGSYISEGVVIGDNVTILPFCYLSGNITIGDGSYIGSGVRMMGDINIGKDVVIRENSVIGAEGLTTDRDEEGKAVSMPQLGGVEIGDHVRIGAGVIIAKGAIDNTVIHSGCKIDNSCFISHNVSVGENTFVVGETIMFGSSSTGKGAYISGNSTIRNGIKIGNNAFVGMGSVVVRDVRANQVVKGNPAE